MVALDLQSTRDLAFTKFNHHPEPGGQSRQTEGGENVKETMLIYLPPELKEEVQILAVKEKTSASALAEEAFKQLLKQRKGAK